MRLCVQQSAHTGQSRDFLLSGFLLFRFLILFLFEIVISMNAFQIQPYALRVCMWETKTYVRASVCVCALYSWNWTERMTLRSGKTCCIHRCVHVDICDRFDISALHNPVTTAQMHPCFECVPKMKRNKLLLLLQSAVATEKKLLHFVPALW